jgi:O-antigen ligase
MKTIKSHEIIPYIFALGLAGIPLFQMQSLADPTLLSRQIYIGFLLLMGLIIHQANANEASISLPKPVIYLSITWLASALFGAFYAKNIQETWYTSSKIILYISAIWLSYGMLQRGSITLKHISIGITLASLISLVLLIIEMLNKYHAGTQLWEQKNLYAIQSVFGHKNLYASFQLLCLPFIFYFTQSKHFLTKGLAISVFVLTLLSIGLIQTKSVILGITLSVAIVIPLASVYVWEREKSKYKIVIALYVLLIIVTSILIYLKQEKFTLLLNNDTLKERLLLWKNTFKMIQEYFPFGVGAGNWQIYFPKYGLQDFMQTNYLISDGYTTFQRPHSDFLWILSELGILGLAAYLGLFIYVFLKGINTLRNTQIYHQKIFLLVVLTAFIAYVFVAMVDFPLERNEHQLLVALIFCILLGSDHNKNAIFSNKTRFVLPALACFISITIAYSLNRAIDEKHSKKMIQAHAQGNWNMIATEAGKINKKLYTIDNFSIPIAWYQGIAQYGMNNPERAKKYFEVAYQINPYQIHVLNNMAGMQEQAGNHKMAIKFYDELLAISPTQPDAILNKSAVFYNQKKYGPAMACLYQFKHDVSNLQYIQFLKTIGFAFLKEELEKQNTPSNQLALKSIANPDFVVFYFKWNKEKKYPFSELKWPN